MDGGEEMNNKKHTGLVIILSVLIVAIVCLLTTIIIFRFKPSNEEENKNSALKCTEQQSLYDINVCIEKVFRSHNLIENVIDEYQAAIKLQKENGNEELSAGLITSMVSFLTAKNYCDQAFSTLESEDLSNYSTLYLEKIYSQALSSGKNCDNTEKVKQYEAKLNEIKDEVDQYVIQSS